MPGRQCLRGPNREPDIFSLERETYRAPALAGSRSRTYLAPVVHGQIQSTFGTMVKGKLTVSLLDGTPQVMNRSDISKLPHMTVKVRGSGGK
jgi:hypothetical protein